MFESILSYSTAENITMLDAIISIIAAFLIGGIISTTYMKSSTKGSHSQGFALTIVLLPAVISAIIMLIGSDIARAFSLAGAFSIIRFRSAPGEPKDIALVLFAMAGGLGCGVGLYQFSLIFTLLVCFVMYILVKTGFGGVKSPRKKLSITVPEDLDYEMAFEDIMNEFLDEHKLINVKTTAMGSLYQLTYEVVFKNDQSTRLFVDEIRCRNSNLNISLNLVGDNN